MEILGEERVAEEVVTDESSQIGKEISDVRGSISEKAKFVTLPGSAFEIEQTEERVDLTMKLIYQGKGKRGERYLVQKGPLGDSHPWGGMGAELKDKACKEASGEELSKVSSGKTIAAIYKIIVQDGDLVEIGIEKLDKESVKYVVWDLKGNEIMFVMVSEKPLEQKKLSKVLEEFSGQEDFSDDGKRDVELFSDHLHNNPHRRVGNLRNEGQDILPHRSPLVFVDEVISNLDQSLGKGTLIFDEEHPFAKQHELKEGDELPLFLIEEVGAQHGAAVLRGDPESRNTIPVIKSSKIKIEDSIFVGDEISTVFCIKKKTVGDSTIFKGEGRMYNDKGKLIAKLNISGALLPSDSIPLKEEEEVSQPSEYEEKNSDC